MQTRHTLLATALAAVLALGAGAHALAAGEEPSPLVLNHGKKWTTDEPLRKSMNEIRNALAVKQDGIHQGTLTSADYQALATTVDAQVATIIAECKLEPAADANLHLIVAELFAGAQAMQGKSANKPLAGAVQTVQAVNRYGQYFDHPDWKALR